MHFDIPPPRYRDWSGRGRVPAAPRTASPFGAPAPAPVYEGDEAYDVQPEARTQAPPPPAPAVAPVPPAADRESLAAALRELEAAKGRVERDAKSARDGMRKQLVLELLPVLDNVERAIASARADGEAPTVVDGMTLVLSQLERVLRGYGVERIDATGKPFDPAIHDAISTIPVRSAAQDRIVIDQIAPGYSFGGALLRPANVVVGRYST